jgi:hypothetical protein
MPREAEVIIGGKIQKFFASDFDARALGGIHPAQFAEQVLFPQPAEARLQGFIERKHPTIYDLRFAIYEPKV